MSPAGASAPGDCAAFCRRTQSELSEVPTTRCEPAGDSARERSGAAYLIDPTTWAQKGVCASELRLEIPHGRK
jgi:hypothetical protein